MNQVFGCPGCQQPFQVEAQQAGQVVQCPACAIQVEIPANAFETASPPPSKPQVFACPACAGQFGITADMNGKRVGCPHCQTAVLIEIPELIVVSSETPVINTSAAKQSSTKTKAKSNPRWKKKVKDSKPSPELPVPGLKDAPDKPETSQTIQPKRRSESKAASDLVPPLTRPPLKTSSPAQVSTQGKKNSPAPIESQVVEAEVVDAEVIPNSEVPAAAGTENESPEPDSCSEIEVETPELANQPEPIDHLLPPLFNVLDPSRMRGKAGTEQFQVVLPDGKGGMQQVDNRVVRVEHGGEKVSLVTMTQKEKSRRRLIQNIIAIVIGIIVLGVAFWLLR